MVVRGQVSVEFFLVLSLLFALAAVLLTTAEAQLRDAESLNNAALSKAALDAVGSYVDLVYLSGNGSIVSGQVFIPASVCVLSSMQALKRFSAIRTLP